MKLSPTLMFLFSRIPIRWAINELNRKKHFSQNQKEVELNLLVSFHMQSNPLYKELFQNEFYSFEELPILQKKDFQAPLDQLLSKGYKRNQCYVASTSGSSGHPFFFAKNRKAHAMTWANILFLYESLGICVFDHQARFYGIPSSGPARLKERIKDLIMNRYRFDVFDLSNQAMEDWISIFSKRKFIYINGYTSAITLFARYCLTRNVQLHKICPTLKYCIVTAETCAAEDLAIMQQAFGIPVIREYGASEVGIIAMENSSGEWIICDSAVHLEVVDELGKSVPDGVEGRILVTDLHNKAMPFIRYEIGDRGILSTSRTGEKILSALSGRTNDLILLPSGKKAAGLTFYYISRSLLEKGGFLKEFIIRQTALDSFIFDIVSERDLTLQETFAIQHSMDHYLEPGLKVLINRIQKIDRKGSGKIKHFYSEINSN